jgi:GTP cyclohydrolase I
MFANDNNPLSEEEKEYKKYQLEDVFRKMLDIMGYNHQDDDNLKETPQRIANMYIDELLQGNYNEPPKIKAFPNTNHFDEMIISGAISVQSICSHHFVPFLGHAYVAYIPNDSYVGISKLARIVHFYMRRPQLQENLTHQIADHVDKLLHPKGVMVIMECQHHCMTIRGVQESEAMMYTSSVRGAFADNASTRNEFFNLIHK